MNWLERIVYYTHSVCFCLRYLPWNQATKIPILIHPSVKIGELHKGDIEIHGDIRRAMISWGFKGVEGRAIRKTYVSIHRDGKLLFNGRTVILDGTNFVIHAAKLNIGKDFLCNSDCFFHVTRDTTIGDNCLLGWNIQFNTTDGHFVYVDGIQKKMDGEIVIGNHVWIGADNLIFKNTNIPDGCIIAQRSLVSKRFDMTNSLIAGIPAKIVKENVTWKG